MKGLKLAVVLIAGSCLAAQAKEDPAIDEPQFLRLIEAASAPLKDLAFVYEGDFRWIGPPADLKPRTPETFRDQFQGSFLYRSHDAELADIYIRRGTPNSSLERKRLTLLNNQIEQWNVLSNQKRRSEIKPEIVVRPGNHNSLSGPQSAHMLIQMWRFLGASQPPGTFRIMGWEAIDGHRCLKVRIDLAQDRASGGFEWDYWIDLNRGGHVLQSELHSGKNLVERLDQVKLVKFTARDGAECWIPVHSRGQGFQWDGRFHGNPVTEQITYVVDGSVVLNQGLPDGVFDVRRETGALLPGELQGLKKNQAGMTLRQEFERAPEEPLRTDAVGIRENLERKLIEADRQSEELEASAPSRESWSWVGASQVVATIIGTAAVVSALILRRRSP